MPDRKKNPLFGSGVLKIKREINVPDEPQLPCEGHFDYISFPLIRLRSK
jgi:hypothetical protein